MTNDKI